MEFIHFVKKEAIDSFLIDGITPTENHHGVGIHIYPYYRINFKAPGSDFSKVKEADEINHKSIEKAWEIVAASKLREGKTKIAALIFKCEPKNWPLKVFIDIPSEIAPEFAKSFDFLKSDEVTYSNSRKLSEVIDAMNHSRYVLESKFQVESESGLKLLIDCFTNSGGGLWAAHSFDCLTLENINPNAIIKAIDL